MLHSADLLRPEANVAASAQEIEALVATLGAPPAAPCIMPKQQLEPARAGRMSLLRLFGVRAPRPGL
ncbi:hypothetical protein SAMN05878503_101339 [Cereibacter ovatus]|uniref:Uncharacterized protein n=1 Tax=Cereibacter ovatus TaxID=439529 RepID=A0A285CJC2_9RHOB|nr:hypothetical protein [Cereibacter ovatus]SNX67701.1 hypothetical protein SAMN05878503_101339 [Cereibacter ovatus]